MKQTDLDIYLNNYDEYEFSILEHLMQIYNFKNINDVIENFSSIKDSNLTSLDINEFSRTYVPKKLDFLRHFRFAPVDNHKHNYIEMSYIYSGEIKEIVNGTYITLKKGDFIILDTNVVHSIAAADSNDIMINFPINKEYFNNSFFNILDSDNVMTNFLLHSIYESHKYNTYLIFHTEENDFVHNLICKIVEEFISQSLNSDNIISSCIILLFYELIRIYGYQMKTEDNTDPSKQNKLTIDILNYVASNYETTTLSSAAQYFNFNPSYFSSIVKKYTKKNFKDLILDEKLKKACYLLRNTSLPIDEIIEKAGISNMQLFYKKFKEQYGVTPHKYRK